MLPSTYFVRQQSANLAGCAVLRSHQTLYMIATNARRVNLSLYHIT